MAELPKIIEIELSTHFTTDFKGLLKQYKKACEANSKQSEALCKMIDKMIIKSKQCKE